MKNKDFAVFILTYNRADRVFTDRMLKKTNYSGDVYFIVDTSDPQIDKYKKKFGDEKVIVFNKNDYKGKFDIMDNFDDDRAVVFARNAIFDIAKKLGIKYFLMLDDDYEGFYYRYDKNFKFISKRVNNLDQIFDIYIDFLKNTKVKSVAMAQAGDFIGGRGNDFPFQPIRLRKCMNTFFCDVDRPFKFIGRINEDVNTFVNNAKFGDIFLTIPWISVVQKPTQSNPGGLTDIYLSFGTYVKSFYTLMINPVAVKVTLMGRKFMRLHHRVNTFKTYPMIISENYKKSG